MPNTRWWSLAFVATGIVCVALLLASDIGVERVVGGSAAILGILALWFAAGRRLVREDRPSALFTAAIVVLAGCAALAHPSLATLQVIIYPVVWILAASVRDAIIASFAVAVSIGVGYTFSYGFSLESLGEATIVVVLSFVFSLAMGLWITRIVTASLERQALVDELRAAHASVAALGRDAGATAERERLAREIHDTIAQDLTGLVLLTQQSRRSLAAGELAAAESQLALLEDSARLALTETRSLVAATSPAALDDGGIGPAIERLGERFSREAGIRVTTSTELTAPLDRATEVVLLRCTQEALANVRKHSAAASVSVAITASGTGVALVVTDDGSGFDAAVAHSGFGLPGMRDRVGLLGGTLEIDSGATGTSLTVALPSTTTQEEHA